MDTTTIVIIILAVGGASYQAYKIGIKEGADQCVEKLREMKIIAYDNKGNNLKLSPAYKSFIFISVSLEYWSFINPAKQ